MNLAELAKKIEASQKKVHSLQVFQAGEILLESYFNGKTESDLQNLFSCTKSISSLLVGYALENYPGFSVQTPVLDLLPEFASLASERTEQMTLHHFLNQTTGIKWMETGRAFAKGHSGFDMEQSSDWLEFLFTQPVSGVPGQRFNYNTGVSHALPLIASRIAGKEPLELVREAFFEPMGIENFHWHTDPAGNPQGGKGLFLCPKDLLKFGKLILNLGEWNGKALVSQDWVVQSTSPQSRGHIYYGIYGYQWWLKHWEPAPLIKRMEHSIICGIGFGGQFLFIVPELDLITVFTGNLIGAENFEYPQSFFREAILPLFV